MLVYHIRLYYLFIYIYLYLYNIYIYIHTYEPQQKTELCFQDGKKMMFSTYFKPGLYINEHSKSWATVWGCGVPQR